MSALLTVSPWSFFFLCEDIQHVVLSVDKNASKFLFAMPGNIYVPLNCRPCGSFNTLTSLQKFSSLSYKRQTDSGFFCLFVSLPKALLLWRTLSKSNSGLEDFVWSVYIWIHTTEKVSLTKAGLQASIHKPNRPHYESVNNTKKQLSKRAVSFLPKCHFNN